MSSGALQIDKYYDIRCDGCQKARSVDINGGLGFWEFSKEKFRIVLKQEGWRRIRGRNLCPDCANAAMTTRNRGVA